MPIHDWTRVEAAIYHSFHLSWITEIHHHLNGELLPDDYYALAEPLAASVNPDVVIPQQPDDEANESARLAPRQRRSLSAVSKVPLTTETDRGYYQDRRTSLTVRHARDDRLVARIEFLSPYTKNTRHALRTFVEKAAELLDRRIHLLILDLFPPGKRDPQGIHAAIWEEITAEEFTQPLDKPLTLVAYETALTVKAYVEPRAVGDTLTEMPLFLEPGYLVNVPLEQTYQNAFAAVPRRWRSVLERP